MIVMKVVNNAMNLAFSGALAFNKKGKTKSQVAGWNQTNLSHYTGHMELIPIYLP